MNYDKLNPDIAIKMLSYIPKRPDYDLWIRIISAIANHYDESTALYILHTRFIDECQNETLLKIRNRMKSINIGTLIYYAKQYGYNADKNVINSNYGTFIDKRVQNYINLLKPLNDTKNEKITLDFKQGINYLYKPMQPIPEFINDVVEIYQNDGYDYYDSISIALHNFEGIQKERAYYVSINKHVLNKNLNPETNSKYGYIDAKTKKFIESFKILNDNFESSVLTKNELIEVISKGYPIVTCKLKQNPDNKYSRKSDTFEKSNLIAIDVDGGISLESALNIPDTKKALLIYTSVSHTEKDNRFRILFPINKVITKDYSKNLQQLIKSYITKYNADKQCIDLARVFYGNNNATIYDLRDNVIMKFRKGERYE